MKIKEVKLEEVTVRVEVLKYGKLKKLVDKFSSLFINLMGLLDIEDDKELADSAVSFIKSNLPEVEKMLFEFTDLTQDTLDEFYITDFPELFKEILSLYNLKVEDILSFFRERVPQMRNMAQTEEDQ